MDRGNAKSLFSTIAVQLYLNLPILQSPVLNVIENDLSIRDKGLQEQRKPIILELLRNVSLTLHTPLFIVVDALDQCENGDVQLIKVWFFPRYDIPGDVLGSRPAPETWGTPAAQFQGNCNINQKFKDHKVVIIRRFVGIGQVVFGGRVGVRRGPRRMRRLWRIIRGRSQRSIGEYGV